MPAGREIGGESLKLAILSFIWLYLYAASRLSAFYLKPGRIIQTRNSFLMKTGLLTTNSIIFAMLSLQQKTVFLNLLFWLKSLMGLIYMKLKLMPIFL